MSDERSELPEWWHRWPKIKQQIEAMLEAALVELLADHEETAREREELRAAAQAVHRSGSALIAASRHGGFSGMVEMKTQHFLSWEALRDDLAALSAVLERQK